MHRGNTFLVESGVETLTVGVYMAWQQQILKDDPHNPAVHMMHRLLGQPDWPFLMMGLGLIVTVVGLSNVNHAHLSTFLTVLMGGLWFSYSVGFFIQDMDFGEIKLTTILSFFVFIDIVTHAFYNDDGGGGKG